MSKNLVIVESPAKAKTIERFLGKDYTVKSSFGHVRDLSKKQLGVDVANGFKPNYEIADDKKKVIAELKKLASQAEMIWLATDEDREGEAISWHLFDTLKLEEINTKRIVFHEITKSAIDHAIKNPRTIDLNLVDAQQARRVLDRLVGFELSPLLWRKVKPALSAGRVQSVAVRLIVEREEEIKSFKIAPYYRVTAEFEVTEGKKTSILKAELPQRFDTKEKAVGFLNRCMNAEFTVSDIETRPFQKSPAPPFTTSTLQQEASRKLGFSVAKTMQVAQQLYESGKITYMRTDSVNLSDLALNMAKNEVLAQFGEKYHQFRKYSTKTKGAQEAHEAIRPSYFDQNTIEGTADQKKLYSLIWKRTIASQMSNANLERTTVNIAISTQPDFFQAKGEVILFDGFLKVYLESTDDDDAEEKRGMLPALIAGQKLPLIQMDATERFTQPPTRYNEATLVKKLEELGIGRPSTYAPIISTVQKREYVFKGDDDGLSRDYKIFTLKAGKIKESSKSEKTGQTKGKLVPTDIGIVVTKFLMQYFDNIMDYQFTATVEKQFDEIALGQKVWNKMIDEFYKPFHKHVESTIEKSEKFSGERLIGTDPQTGKNIFAKIGRFGPIVQIGDTESEEKPRFSALKKGQTLDNITLDEALDLFKLPRTIGIYEEEEMVASTGRFGPYIRHRSKFYSLSKGFDPLTLDAVTAIDIIEKKRKQDSEKTILSFGDEDAVQVLNGRWGPYISYQKNNYKIPKGTDPKTLTLEDCQEIIRATGSDSKPAARKNSPATKKTTPAAGKKSPATSKTKRTAKAKK
ncbi:MAG: type I DNA topoisomerase [Bacteroidales bacterium]|nr:type I DNA topoisomerase [Bacteroidales bacterium]